MGMMLSIFKKWWVWIIAVLTILIGIVGGWFVAQVLNNIDLIQSGVIQVPQNFTAAGNTQALPQAQAPAPANQLFSSRDPSFGTPGAFVTVVEFSDFQCPFCRQAFPIVRKLMQEYGTRVRFVYRDFPVIEIHPEALAAANAALCAHAQGKFWEYHDLLFINQNQFTQEHLFRYAQTIGLDLARFQSCVNGKRFEQEVLNDLNQGIDVGVRGTPTFFFNGVKVEGVIPEPQFRLILDELLKRSTP